MHKGVADLVLCLDDGRSGWTPAHNQFVAWIL